MLARSTSELEAALRAKVRGEVDFDLSTCLLYASDASIYRQEPIGVVCPTDSEDLATVVGIATGHGVPLLARGAGTSLAGQTTTPGLVVDVSRHLRRIGEVDIGGTRVHVEPGVVLDELNAQLRPTGLMFAPDVATSNRATIGGMIGNNSCGSRSIRYGKTGDHVLTLETVLSGGERLTMRELSEEEWEHAGRGDHRAAGIYRGVHQLCAEHAEEIERRYPRIMRRVGGYNLDMLTRHGRRSLAPLVVGSEGTLAVVAGAWIHLVPVPAASALLVSHFSTLQAALEAAPLILGHEPSAIELIDRLILDLTRGNPALASARGFVVGDPEAILITEFQGETAAEVGDRIEGLRAALEKSGIAGPHIERRHLPEIGEVWAVRKAGLGLLMGTKGDRKPTGFIEDTAVPVERLADFIRELRALLEAEALTACFYGHASVGCLHVRPLLNLRDPADRARLRPLSRAVAELVLRYGGAMSAEHGDGLARSEWNELLFGPQLVGAFQQLKRLFDPMGLMNPGKIVDAPAMDTHLRVDTPPPLPAPRTLLDFSVDGGLPGHALLCTGIGACRKRLDGVMCPSFRATGEERHSPRGRATLAQVAFTGLKPGTGVDDPELLAALDLCLECKACGSECPSNVDIARLKSEVLHQTHQSRGIPLRARLLAHPEILGRFGSVIAPVANALLAFPLIRTAMQALLGLDARRPLPPFARPAFRQRWALDPPRAEPSGAAGSVLLFVDTFTNYHEPQIGFAAVRVLRSAGYHVRVADHGCCGRALISKGLLNEARARAEELVGRLLLFVRDGIPVVVLEPSCLSALKDEFLRFGLGAGAEEVAAGCWTLEEFLARAGSAQPTYGGHGEQLLFHPHCHQRALWGQTGSRSALEAANWDVRDLPAGCCGMAGSFGYEAEHAELSRAIGELGLLPAVRAAAPTALVVASGTSCRQQIRDLTGRTVLHPAEALDRALAEEGI